MGVKPSFSIYNYLLFHNLPHRASQEGEPFHYDLEEIFGDTQLNERLEEPPKYHVLLLNDDYTTFDFVVHILVSIFKKTIEEAVQITSDVHHKGQGICGTYTKQIAETKVAIVDDLSQSAGYPLKCVMEEA